MSNKYDDGESRLNEYEVVKKIGNGRFGEVFLVKHKRTQEFFCWKAISYRGLKEREKSQLVIEVNVMRELKHKNIVRYIDRFLNKANQKLYILMEFCDAGDLSRNIQKCYKMFGKIEEHAIVDITRQLLQALAYCHNLKEGPNGERVLHRDLKPQNIFLSTGIRHVGKITAQANNLTSRPIAKIGDFGLSKNIGIESMAHSCVGTPYYWSPELLLHETKSYDDKSDMWALGCIIYELCSGKTPFHKANNFAQLVSELKKGPEFPLKGKSRELNFLVKSLLSLSPKDRPSALQCMGFQIIKQIAPPASSQASSAGSLRKEPLMDQQKEKENKNNEAAGGAYASTTNQGTQMRNKERQRSSSCLSQQNINTMRYRNDEVGGGTQRSNGIYEIGSDKMPEKGNMERNRMEKEYAQGKVMEMKMRERERMERDRIERERMERDRIERDRMERERMERERMERERMERERVERERLERERMERERIERERIERERMERERIERERMERMEREKIERMERLKRMEQERMEQIKRERIEKMERERLEEIERERERERFSRERDRMSRDRLHSDRISRNRIDSERLERDRMENDRRDRYYTRNIESNSQLDMVDKMKLQSKNQGIYSNTRLKDKYDPPVSGAKNYRYGSRKSTYDDSEDFINKGEVYSYMKKNSVSNVSSKNISRYSNNSTTISNNYNNGVDGYTGYTNQSTISQYSNNSAESGKLKSTNPYQGRMTASKNPKEIYSTDELMEPTYKSSKYEKSANDMNNVCKSSRVSNVYFNDSARRSVSLLPPVHSTTKTRSSIYQNNNNTLREEREHEIEEARESRNYKNMKDREYLLEQRKVLIEKKNESYGIAKPNDNYGYVVASKCDNSRYDPMKSMHRVNENNRRNRSMSVCTNDPTKKNSYRMKDECDTREDSEEFIMRNRNMYNMKNMPRNSKYEGNMYTCQ